MKTLLTLLAIASMTTLSFGADKKAPCCEKAIKAGKTCEHPCCVKAEKDGKVCENCNKE